MSEKNTTFHKIQRINSIPILDIHRQYGYITSHSIPKESKALISFLNKLGTERKLQSFNLNDLLKGFWYFM